MKFDYLSFSLFFSIILSSIVVFVNHRLLLYIILFLSFFLDNFLFIFKLPVTLNLIIDCMIFIYLFYAIIPNKKFEYRKKTSFYMVIHKNLKIIIALIIGCSLIIYILKPYSIILAIRSGLNFFRYMALFFALRKLETNKNFYFRTFKLITILALIQIPYSILQTILFYSISYDFKGGSLSLGGYSTNGGTVFASIFFVYFFMIYRIKKKYIYLILVLLFLIPIILSSGKAGFFFIIINLLFYFVYLEQGIFKKYVRLIFWTILLIVSTYYIMIYLMPILDLRNVRAIGILTDYSKFESYTFNTTKMGNINRLQFFNFWLDQFDHNKFEFFLGGGLGNYTMGGYLSATGSAIDYFGTFLTGLHSFAYYALELGFLNLLLYFYFFVIIIKQSKKRFRSKKVGLHAKYLLGFATIFFFTLMYTSIYWKIWAVHGIAFTQWFLLAALSRIKMLPINSGEGPQQIR